MLSSYQGISLLPFVSIYLHFLPFTSLFRNSPAMFIAALLPAHQCPSYTLLHSNDPVKWQTRKQSSVSQTRPNWFTVAILLRIENTGCPKRGSHIFYWDNPYYWVLRFSKSKIWSIAHWWHFQLILYLFEKIENKIMLMVNNLKSGRCVMITINIDHSWLTIIWWIMWPGWWHNIT